MSKIVYKRIVIKLSGESLSASSKMTINPQVLSGYINIFKELLSMNIEVAVVVGGGNFFRGAALSDIGLSRISGDHMGMLATVMNALAMRDIFERNDIPTRIMSSIPMSGIVDYYDRRKAIYNMKNNRLVIFASGTGHPLATTDSAASLRAIEVDADLLIKATNVDGIYDKDPKIYSNAKLYDKISFDEVLKQELSVMDLASFCQCRDHNLPIQVCNIKTERAIQRIVSGDLVGTMVY